MIKKLLLKWFARYHEQEAVKLAKEIARTKSRNRISVVFGVLLVAILYSSDIDMSGDAHDLLISLPWSNMAVLAVAYIFCLVWFDAVNAWMFCLRLFLAFTTLMLMMLVWSPLWIIPGAVAIPNIQMIIMVIDALEIIMIIWDVALLLPIMFYGISSVVTTLRRVRGRVVAEIINRILSVFGSIAD